MLTPAAQEALAFIEARWDRNMAAREWAEVLVDSGWAAPRWPVEFWGRGLSDDAAKEAEAVFDRYSVPGTRADSTNLWAATVMAYGSADLKRRFVRPLLLDRVAMCLLYSEPDAGSDLANVKTSADRDGDEWVISGQKVWTSGAATAEYGMLVARTDDSVDKHRGLTFFLFPMRQEGVEVRPLRQATGDSRFNEVFITEARVDDANRLGPINGGWRVLVTALAYERAVLGIGQGEGPPSGGATAEAMGAIPVADVSLVDLAVELGLGDDPATRQRIARLYCQRRVKELTAERARSEVAKAGSSPLVSLSKLAMSEILHSAGRLQGHLLGAEGMLDGAQNPRAASAAYSQLNAYFTSIGGGTDQIQRNIIAERLLGLPKDLPADPR